MKRHEIRLKTNFIPSDRPGAWLGLDHKPTHLVERWEDFVGAFQSAQYGIRDYYRLQDGTWVKRLTSGGFGQVNPTLAEEMEALLN